MLERFTRHTAVELTSIQKIHDATVELDGYELTINHEGQACIRYSNARGLRYGDRTLEALKQQGVVICEIYEYPEFRLRGTVEGFYGEPYTFQTRRELIDFSDRHRMNCYFYAPKDDPYHRERWREPYEATLLQEIAALNQYAQEKLVDFYFCISPGKDFRFGREADYSALFDKLRAVKSVGVERFTLLMDDIDPKLCAEDTQIFETSGRAHAHLIDRCVGEIPAAAKWVFCPTEYMQDFDTDYRKQFKLAAKEDFYVFWTGYNTVAEVITRQQSKAAASCFDRELLLWDNYPVNDFAPKRRKYLGPIINRSPVLGECFAGYVANPMSDFAASQFALATQAEYMFHPTAYDPQQAIARACLALIPDASDAAMVLVRENLSGVLAQLPNKRNAFQRKDFAALDAIYDNMARAAETLLTVLTGNLKQSLAGLCQYMLDESALYRSCKSGSVKAADVEKLTNAPYRTQDQSLLEFINEQQYIDLEIAIEPEREIWWRTEGGTRA